MQVVNLTPEGLPDESELSPPLGSDETYAFNLVGTTAEVFDRRPMTVIEMAIRDLKALEASGTGTTDEFRQLARLAREVAGYGER